MNIQFHGTSQQGKGISVPPEPPPAASLVIAISPTTGWTDTINLTWDYNTGNICGAGNNVIDVSANYAWTLEEQAGPTNYSVDVASGTGGIIETVTFSYTPEAPDVETTTFDFKIDGNTLASITHTSQDGCPG